VKQLGRGYEYVDLDGDPGGGDDADEQQHTAATAASGQRAGPLGFAGTARTGAGVRAAGLTTLPGDAFNGGPKMPMMSSTWEPDQSGEPYDGNKET
jgi:PPE-repeat protein